MLPPHTLVVEDFGEFRELIQSWIEGHYELMVILGGAGLGKCQGKAEQQMGVYQRQDYAAQTVSDAL